MAVVDVRYAADWSNATTNWSEIISSCYGLSAALLMQSIRLSKVEADSRIMVLRPVWLLALVRYGFDGPDSDVALPNGKLARDCAWHSSSCSDADLFEPNSFERYIGSTGLVLQ